MITAAQIPNDTVTGNALTGSALSGDTMTGYVHRADTLFEDARKLYDNAGTGSGAPSPLMADPIINNYFYIGAVLLLFAAFCYMIYYYRQEIALLFSEGPKDKMLNEQSLVFKQFLGFGVCVSLLFYTLAAIKIADIIGIANGFADTGQWWMLGAVILLSALVLAVYAGYRRVINALVAKVTHNDMLFSQYSQLTRIFLMMGVIVLIPLFFVLVLTRNPDSELFIWIILGLSAVIYILYLVRSLRFFRQKNVSIFHWFLYLCAVEFFPLSYLFIITVRLSQ